MEKNNKPVFFKNFLKWFLIFYIIFFGIQYFFGTPKEQEETTKQAEITITPERDSYVIGNMVRFIIENQTSNDIQFQTPCEQENENLKVLFVATHGEQDIQTDISKEEREECLTTEITDMTVPAQTKIAFQTKEYNQDLFAEPGDYKLQMNFMTGEEQTTITSSTVTMEKPGVLRQLFRALISRPLFNILVFFTEVFPGHSYGLAIIGLTILVRLALFIPNKKAMKSQRELQKIQPKLLEIKEKNKGNQQVIAMKTMELYKTHKINPLGGILPILLQMPFLLGIFYIIRDGISPHLSYLLYGFYQNANLHAGDNMFLGLDLSLAQGGNGWKQIALALTVAAAQFTAIRLSTIRAKKQNEKNGVVAKKKKSDDPLAAVQNASKVMMYVMPGLVAVFSLSFPAGVGIYWLTSTIFGAGQQYFVNKESEQPQVVRKKD